MSVRQGSLVIQEQQMMKHLPEFACSRTPSSRTWIGWIQPSASSQKYRVKITYALDDIRPHVTVLEPELRKRTDSDGTERSIPHTYPGPELCLFLPRSGEWTPDVPIATSVVPWASLWLYFYEAWLATGEWLGEGEHPPPATKQQIDKMVRKEARKRNRS